MLAKVDGIHEVWKHGISFECNGNIISIEFYPYAWTYCFKVEVDGRGVWAKDTGTVKEILRRLAGGDRWSMMILKLISLLGPESNIAHTRRVFDTKVAKELNDTVKSGREENVLRGLWISVMRWEDLNLADRALEILKEYGDVFVNRKVYRKYLDKFKDVELHLLAKRLSKKR